MPNCPSCGTKMGKSGFRWSGSHKVQRWTCSKCGKTTTKTGKKDGGR